MTTLTPSQQQAIQQRGNVLVVAGAGTGKTSTLVNRCVSLLLEENCSLDEILMVTFTDAAAAQMRSRIRMELLRLQRSLAEDAPQAEQVHKQLALLDAAHICTLHSFCLQLVRTHFYQLGIDPAVSVLDEKQTAPLIQQTLNALFHSYYGEDTPEAIAVQELIRAFGGGSVERIQSQVLKLHRYTQALDDAEGWLAQQEAIYQEEEPVAWQRWFETGFNEWRKAWLPELKPHAKVTAVDLFMKTLAAMPEGPLFEEAAKALQQLRQADENDKNWPRGTKTSTRQVLKTFLSELDFLASLASGAGVSPAPPGVSPANLAPGVRPSSGAAPSEVPHMPVGSKTSESGSVAASEDRRTPTADPLQQDWQWVRPHLLTLLRLARQFTAAFGKAKREQGGIDFADLEQFALRLLRDPAIARQWQQRLRFIFVDECQDINRAQDAIITALSRECTQPNRFLVGDVKQSIYRFRLANPKIFCRYEEAWRKPGANGTRIALADNFRSREALLHFANSIFATLMRSEVGGVSYESDVHLRFGKAEERKELACPTSSRVEFHLIDGADMGGEGAEAEEQAPAQIALLDLMAIDREARLVGLRLLELRQQKHLIWDTENEQFRPVEWRDLVVLMRSPSGRVEAFAKEFHRLGIPLSAARSGFFQSVEVMDLLNVLKLIDNPLQDVPLLAVLRSPLVGFSLDELAELRAHDREKPFWMALQKFQRQSPKSKVQSPRPDEAPSTQHATRNMQHASSAKAALFLDQFAHWRELARQSSLSQCLETVLAETHYEALLLAEPRGGERVANVRRLLELAREYDPYQRQGLYRFLRFVAAQEEAEVELEPASAQTEDAVRLMSIHKSKGLEFPVVVLAGLGSQFNLQDLRQDLLLHETYGLCAKVKPPGAEQSYPSLPYWLARRDERRELLGEEMRLLYVALTRARDTLILTGNCTGSRWVRPVQGSGSSRRKEALIEIRNPKSEIRNSQSLLTSAATIHGDNPASPLTTRTILSARSYLDWLLMWLPTVTASEDWSNERAGETALLSWRTYATNDARLAQGPDEPMPSLQDSVVEGELDEVGLLKLQERILWHYPFAAATKEPAVKRVSALIWDQDQSAPDGQILFNYNAAERRIPLRREDPGQDRAGLEVAAPFPPGSRHATNARKRPSSTLAAADLGSVHHRFLEIVDLAHVGSLEDLQQQTAQMLEAGALTDEEAHSLNLQAVLAFWTSEIGRTILSQTPHIHREIPFTARFSPQDFAALDLCSNAADLPGEYFVVRGKADLAVLLPKETWLLDFKTGQLSQAESEERAAFYAPQLKLYALALSRIYRRPVTHRWLHFLDLGKTVSV